MSSSNKLAWLREKNGFKKISQDHPFKNGLVWIKKKRKYDPSLPNHVMKWMIH